MTPGKHTALRTWHILVHYYVFIDLGLHGPEKDLGVHGIRSLSFTDEETKTQRGEVTWVRIRAQISFSPVQDLPQNVLSGPQCLCLCNEGIRVDQRFPSFTIIYYYYIITIIIIALEPLFKHYASYAKVD